MKNRENKAIGILLLFVGILLISPSREGSYVADTQEVVVESDVPGEFDAGDMQTGEDPALEMPQGLLGDEDGGGVTPFTQPLRQLCNTIRRFGSSINSLSSTGADYFQSRRSGDKDAFAFVNWFGASQAIQIYDPGADSFLGTPDDLGVIKRLQVPNYAGPDLALFGSNILFNEIITGPPNYYGGPSYTYYVVHKIENFE